MVDVRSDVEKLSPYVCARDLYKYAEVFLDANENSLGSAVDSTFGNLNRYPDSDCIQLRKAISGYTGAKVEQVLAGNGSDEIIALTLNAFAEKGDNIVTVEPGYGMYSVCAQIAGVEARTARLSNQFEIDLNAVTEKIDSKTKAIFFPSPNAPIGNPVKEEEIRKILKSFDGVVFVDEAYYEFYGKTIISLVNEYDNLIVSRTLSKAWGLAGIRVGYCISTPQIISGLRKIKPPYNIGCINQLLATKALVTGKEKMLDMVERIKVERERLAVKLRLMDLNLFPSVTNFLLARLPQYVKAKQVECSLAEKRIIIRDRSNLPMLDNCIRITVGTRLENDLLLEGLENILEENE